MGTNYYHVVRGKPDRHIGKSSGGWCFALHVYPEEGINTLEDWTKRLVKSGKIRDENGTSVALDFMMERIEDRKWPIPMTEEQAVRVRYNSLAHFHETNHSEPGPNNLLRHKVDGVHCIGQGLGTWDYIIGDFS